MLKAKRSVVAKAGVTMYDGEGDYWQNVDKYHDMIGWASSQVDSYAYRNMYATASSSRKKAKHTF